MLTRSNKERLEQEIGSLIRFIAAGRDFFFKQTGFSVQSPDTFANHFVCKELFCKHPELIQLELNIQLLYIKLASYYKLTSRGTGRKISKERNVFAHELTDLIFQRRVRYNFFLHKASQNFKKLQFLFYDEEADHAKDPDWMKAVDLELDRDIKEFLAICSRNPNSRVGQESKVGISEP